MAPYSTSKGRDVEHCHLGQAGGECEATELSPNLIAAIRATVKRTHPKAVEIKPPTNTYNCIGYALARSHGWFNDPERFFADDYTDASFESPQKCDVVIYYKQGVFSHVAVVTMVNGGQITRVQSKWANFALLSHELEDTGYGKPVQLLRPNPGVVPLADLIHDVEIPELAGVVSSTVSRGIEEMPEYESTEEAIRGALERILEPDVYLRVGLASTPESARVLIEELPGVQELIAIGPEAKQAVFSLLERGAEMLGGQYLSGIALYLMQRIPMKEAVRLLARGFSEGKFTGINLYLAADALLTSAGIEVVSEDPLVAASRAAEELK